MRRTILAISAALALAACGDQAPAPGGPLPPSAIAGAGDPFWKGAFAPISSTAETGPGDLTFLYPGFGQAGGLAFGKGLVLQTAPVSQPKPADPYSGKGEETWANLLTLPDKGEVELRQVTSVATPPGGAAELCAGAPVTWVAVGLRPGLDHPGSVSIAAFTGAEAPGGKARDSEVCAVYEYGIPG